MWIQILSLVIASLSLLSTVALGFFVAPMVRKSTKIETLEGDLREANERQIKTEMSTQTTELRMRVGSIEHRLSAGDLHLKRLDDGLIEASKRDHEAQLAVMREISALKEIVATKDDLKELRENMEQIRNARSRD